MLGFPIRTSPDQRSVANSPGLIAGSNVLHRLLMPRHPPCALHSLPNKTNTTKINSYKDARVHYTNLKQHTHQETNPPTAGQPQKGSSAEADASDTQQCATTPTPHTHPHHTAGNTQQKARSSMSPLVTPKKRPTQHTAAQYPQRVLLRKEVIQPHLPVRLPCYDFVPITSPTFDGSPHKG